MRRAAIGLGLLGLAVLLPALADTGAGLAAFKMKNYDLAWREWKASAEAGQAEAQFDLGVLYAQGLGVRRDLSEASNWYGKAARQGNAEAEFALGQLYLRGWGVPRDEADALRWFDLANSVESDGPPTDWALVEGYGMPRDAKQASYWYQLAADQGHAEAQFNLGRLFASGQGVKRDAEQAARWISAAATQGFVPAMNDLGARYASGAGVARSARLAYLWLTLAFLRGDRSVEKLRAAQAATLGAAEVATQDRAAQNWKPRMAVRPNP